MHCDEYYGKDSRTNTNNGWTCCCGGCVHRAVESGGDEVGNSSIQQLGVSVNCLQRIG